MLQDGSKPDGSPPPYYESCNGGAINRGFEETENETNVDLRGNGSAIAETGIRCKKIDAEDDGIKIEVDEDPWKISTVYVEVIPWSDLSTCGKVKRVLWDYLGKIILLLGFLYLFICSLDFLSNAFRLIGGKTASSIFAESELLSNPIAGLMMGILGTVLFQSSSTTTSVIVSMVAASIIPVKNAIPVIMGANIGTSVTNTIVAIGQITNKNDHRRAFAGATVHDMFNWLTVIVLLPIEAATGYLFHLSDAIVKSMHLETNAGADQDFLKKITSPFTKLIIQLDRKIIQDIAQGKDVPDNATMIKHCCEDEDVVHTFNNGTMEYNVTHTRCLEKCKYLFESVSNKWSDSTVGIVLLIMALFILCICLVCIVKTLHSLLQGRVNMIIKKFVNAEFPGKCSYFTGYLAILVGTGLTFLVQSSSIFTSALTPLVGIGIISIERMYHLTLGANIGTTTTAVLAALAQDAEDIPNSLQISMCHLFFNLSGILLYFPIPFTRWPIDMAKFLGNQTAKYRWFAAMYLIVFFFLLPATVFGLSLISWIAMAAVLVPIILIIIFVTVINILQKKFPKYLPAFLRDWYFLPEVLRSLRPFDRVITKLMDRLSCCKNKEEEEEGKPTSDIKTEIVTKM